MLNQKPRFNFVSIGEPLNSALERDADLVDWALKVPMSIPAFLRTFFDQLEIMKDTTGLCGLIILSKSWEHSSTDLQLSAFSVRDTLI